MSRERETELTSFYEQVREAINREWDPIGVSMYSEEVDEYDGYIPSLCRLLREKASRDQIFEYLWTIETESIGLSGNKEATEEFTDRLICLANSADE